LADAPDLGIEKARFQMIAIGFVDEPGIQLKWAFSADPRLFASLRWRQMKV
jgi:hypothetical protein